MNEVENIEMADDDDLGEQFPIGMRVLAVDDDPTCLKILEALLRKCQYHVTATKSAIAALNLLRENKNKFDLVVSDVHMPDMDGFQLLEFVGLEMDLPVIMLSVNDDPKMVMKGIHHGACDYLLKPVRIEELRNIWQHVIRRRKNTNLKQWNKASNNQGKPNDDGCYETGLATKGDSDQNQKPSKKRRDPDEDDYEENENGHDTEVLSNQKKPRIVWNTDLHRKFVAAVNELGVDKAVPKKILEIMKEERLTRENVASHLQKYRLYLKRISQQANMVAGLVGGADTSYLRMSSLNGIGHFNTLSGPEKYHNNAYRSFSCGGITGRYNTSVGLNVHGLPPSETLQTLNNSMNDPLRFQSGIVHGNQNEIQGIPMSVGLDQLQQNKGVCVSPIQNLNSHFGAKSAFPLSAKLPDQVQKVTMGCPATPGLDISNNALVMKANPQDTQGSGVYDNSQFSFPLLDNGRWSSPMQPCGTNSYRPPSGNFRLRPTDNMSCANLQGGNMSAASSITSLSSQSPDSLTDIFTNNIPGQISNGVSFQGWNDINLDSGYLSSVIDNPMDSLISMNGNVDPEGHSSMNSNLDFSFCNPLQMKHDEVMGLSDEASLKPQEGYTMSQQKTW